MNQTDYSLLDKMNIKDDVIVINQYYGQLVDLEEPKLKWVNVKEIGLSKSRNLAIRISNHDIVLLSDDDITYVDNVREIMTNAFEQNAQYDILTFQVFGKEEFSKNTKIVKLMSVTWDL